ncbi:sensor histidine kinase [Enterovibrio baiacu]|uniref:sensor histidine kinase n=1 Tax=Enterovibrio baiacu TaxID=2491023 RepID=UPI001010A140|nr:HAMP domain-containing sensor histidine kinase [Enterovibrio baiacu]MBE1277210.1 sensor histidine kinase [Enterovibrio baiacu]
MSSEKSVSNALAQTQKALFFRFVTVLLTCLFIVQVVIAVLLLYRMQSNDIKILSSMGAEYQRILTFNGSEKLTHVVVENPERLEENNIAVFKQDPSNPAVFHYVSGAKLALPESEVADFPSKIAHAESSKPYGYNSQEESWYQQLITQSFLTLPLVAKRQGYIMVQPIFSDLSAVISEWLRIGFALLVLAAISLVFVWRLIHSTLSPLFVLARQLDDASKSPLESMSNTLDFVQNANRHDLSSINRSVNLLLMRLHKIIKSMDDTVNAIAHDLRTPLSRLRLSAEKGLLTKKEDENGAQVMKEALADCLESSHQADQMLTTLLKINDEVAGRLSPKLSHIDINATLLKVAGWYEETAEDHDIQLTVISHPTSSLLTDEDKLIQILVNLVDNALKFTPKGGTVQLAYSEHNNLASLSVTDSGIGIPKDKHALIFTKLYRADESRTSEGYGLGLAHAKAITESLAGKLTVESEVGKGSTFTINLVKAT